MLLKELQHIYGLSDYQTKSLFEGPQIFAAFQLARREEIQASTMKQSLPSAHSRPLHVPFVVWKNPWINGYVTDVAKQHRLRLKRVKKGTRANRLAWDILADGSRFWMTSWNVKDDKIQMGVINAIDCFIDRWDSWGVMLELKGQAVLCISSACFDFRCSATTVPRTILALLCTSNFWLKPSNRV